MTKEKVKWADLMNRIEKALERQGNLTGADKLADEVESVMYARGLASFALAVGCVELRDIMNDCEHLERNFHAYQNHILSELRKLNGIADKKPTANT
jgi:hypothetical protein